MSPARYPCAPDDGAARRVGGTVGWVGGAEAANRGPHSFAHCERLTGNGDISTKGGGDDR